VTIRVDPAGGGHVTLAVGGSATTHAVSLEVHVNTCKVARHGNCSLPSVVSSLDLSIAVWTFAMDCDQDSDTGPRLCVELLSFHSFDHGLEYFRVAGIHRAFATVFGRWQGKVVRSDGTSYSLQGVTGVLKVWVTTR